MKTLLIKVMAKPSASTTVVQTVLPAGSATVLTVISQFVPVTLMGFGFLLGASAFLLAAVVRLAVFTDNLPYRVLGAQPIVATEKRGWFTKLGEALDEFGERLHGTFGRKES